MDSKFGSQQYLQPCYTTLEMPVSLFKKSSNPYLTGWLAELNKKVKYSASVIIITGLALVTCEGLMVGDESGRN